MPKHCMSKYCPICDEYTNCTENCKECLREEEENGQETTERTH